MDAARSKSSKGMGGCCGGLQWQPYRGGSSRPSTELFVAFLKRPYLITYQCLSGREWFWSQLKHATQGVGARRERTRPGKFRELVMPMPDVQQQSKGVVIFRQVDALRRLQGETAIEIDALLPSIIDKAFKGEL